LAEEIIAAHPDMAECAVIGASDRLKAKSPLALVVSRQEPLARIRRSPPIWLPQCVKRSDRQRLAQSI